MQTGIFVRDFFLSILSTIMMIVMAIVSFFFTVFIVDFGATMAGYPNDSYTVLSAALLVSASIVAGGISPIGTLGESPSIQKHEDEPEPEK